MSEKNKAPKPMYACSKCCRHLHELGELCDKCHEGRAVQIYPVIKSQNTDRRKTVMYRGIKTPRGRHTFTTY